MQRSQERGRASRRRTADGRWLLLATLSLTSVAVVTAHAERMDPSATALTVVLVVTITAVGFVLPAGRARRRLVAVLAACTIGALVCALVLPTAVFRAGPLVENRPRSPANGRVAALTFDDGPGPWTDEVLAVLAAERVKATFFVTGTQARKHEGLLRWIVEAGHVVGGHSYSHLDMRRASRWRNVLEVVGTELIIEGIIGLEPTLFRPPFGSEDEQVLELVRAQGYVPVGWNIDTLDWTRPGVDKIVARVLGSDDEKLLVLMHDAGSTERSQTVAALPLIIDGLRQRGYRFVTADEMLGVPPYQERDTPLEVVRGIAVIATYRAFAVTADLTRLAVSVVVALALARLAIMLPLAVGHVARSRQRGTAAAGSGSIPTVSVVIPAYNEAPVIAKTIASVAACDPQPAEVIVVDDGSTDATSSIVRACAEQLGGDLVELVCQANAGKAAALERGFRHATGDVVLVIDADTVVDPGIVGVVGPHFLDPEVGAVAGNVKVGNRRRFWPAFQALEYVVALNLDRRAQDQLGTVAVVPGAAGAFRRRAVQAAGGYTGDTLAEDADLTVRLQLAGWRVRYEPRAVTYTEGPETLRDVVRQRRRWSFGTIQVLAKHIGRLGRPSAGRIGMVGLPMLLITQVLNPLLLPLVELHLLVALMSGTWSQAATSAALVLSSELLVATYAVLADRERARLLAVAPLDRIVWRPLQAAIVISSALRWLAGAQERWRTIHRTGAVAPVHVIDLSVPATIPSAVGATVTQIEPA